MLTREIVTDRVEILEDGSIQVRTATYFVEDGVRISSPMYHRAAYSPGAELPSIIDKRIADVAAVVWTKDVLDTFDAKVTAQRTAMVESIESNKAVAPAAIP